MNLSRPGVASRTLHVLCASDTFKGTLPSDKVGEAVEAGYRQAWQTLLHPTSAHVLPSHPLPPITRPPPSAAVDGVGRPLVAMELLAASLVAPPSHPHSVDDHHHSPPNTFDVPPQGGGGGGVESAFVGRRNEPRNADDDAPAMKTTTTPTAVVSVAFTHTPMSDGGAGLIDSVTFPFSRTTARTGRHVRPQEREVTNAVDGSGDSSDTSDAPQLQRVYVPAATTITGPLGVPIPHTGAPDASSSSSSSAAAAAARGGVSFACDVARRVLVVEMAEAAGLPRIAHPQDRDPSRTTSYGVGELIKYALRYMEAALRDVAKTDADGHHGCPLKDERGVRLFLGIGGSSTNDGGLGALQALGLDIFVQPTVESNPTSSAPRAAIPGETEDVLLCEPFCGGHLRRLTRVHVSDAMKQLFPYLGSHTAVASPSTDFAAPGKDEDGSHATSLYVKELCLICDVDNTLVGSHGATYTFGPQKCAPPPLSPPPTSLSIAGSGTGDDAAVGVITSAGQKLLLDSLEAGMRHAAARVVASTWRQLVPPCEWPHVKKSAAAVAPQDQLTRAETERDAEAAVLADLLYRPGGGGAGGMSGFFRYLLKARYVPGTDMVAGLLGLYETPLVAQMLGNNEGDVAATRTAAASALGGEASLSVRCPAVRHPRGTLFRTCDVVVSGEGSFDDQTISSHKTVGRLLEMCTAANAYRLWQKYCCAASTPEGDEVEGAFSQPQRHASPPPHRPTPSCLHTIKEFVVVCGQTSFEDYTSCQSAVLRSVCSSFLSSTPSFCAAEPEATGGMTGSTEINCSSDTIRVKLYLRDLLSSSTFRNHCDALRAESPDVGGVDACDRDAACILRHYCVPRVTVLPLTPMLFSFADATQRPYACLTAAVATLLEDSVHRLVA
jgi:glycerate kinase